VPHYLLAWSAEEPHEERRREKRMRKHLALIGLGLAFSIMLGIALVTGHTANVVHVDVNIWPRFLTVDGYDWHHNHSFDEWVIAFIQLPRDYSTRDVDLASITLQVNGGGSVPVSHYYAILGRIIVAKFDRAQVIDLLRTSMGHMTPYPVQKVTLVVTGDLHDGNVIRGEDTITVYFVDN
jgi:hypothetical protein